MPTSAEAFPRHTQNDAAPHEIKRRHREPRPPGTPVPWDLVIHAQAHSRSIRRSVSANRRPASVTSGGRPSGRRTAPDLFRLSDVPRSDRWGGGHLSDLQDGLGHQPDRARLHLPCAWRDPHARARNVPDKRPDAAGRDARARVDLSGTCRRHQQRAWNLLGRRGDARIDVAVAGARRPQPEARRTVLHGAR